MSQTAIAKLLEPEAEEVHNLQRPNPTPEQAALGIAPAATGKATFQDIMKVVRSFPRLTDEEWEAFDSAISQSRAERRQLEAGGHDRMSRLIAMGCFDIDDGNLYQEDPHLTAEAPVHANCLRDE